MSKPTAVVISPLVQTDEGRLRAVRLDNGSCCDRIRASPRESADSATDGAA